MSFGSAKGANGIPNQHLARQELTTLPACLPTGSLRSQIEQSAHVIHRHVDFSPQPFGCGQELESRVRGAPGGLFTVTVLTRIHSSHVAEFGFPAVGDWLHIRTLRTTRPRT